MNDPNTIVDPNVITNTSGAAGNNFLTIGSSGTFFSRPGTYGDHNIVDTVGIASEVAAYDDVTTFTYDFHLLPNAPARGRERTRRRPPTST